MRIKSKICYGVIGVASLVATPSLFATYTVIGTGSLFIQAPGFNGTGDQAGPYQITSLVDSTGVNPGSSFETFCIGTQVDYSPGNTYSYQISDTVQPVAGVGSPGYVTWGAAWLYSQYRANALGDGVNNDPENDALQEAIWVLQGQSLSGIDFSPDSTDFNNFMSKAAAAATLAGISSDTNDASGAFGVYALNMLSGGTYVQPQLCMVPTPLGGSVPEPSTVLAGALLLLPCGLSAIRILRKQTAVS